MDCDRSIDLKPAKLAEPDKPAQQFCLPPLATLAERLLCLPRFGDLVLIAWHCQMVLLANGLSCSNPGLSIAFGQLSVQLGFGILDGLIS